LHRTSLSKPRRGRVGLLGWVISSLRSSFKAAIAIVCTPHWPPWA
jgi:hypothetical protein